jgi:hypothetical protein
MSGVERRLCLTCLLVILGAVSAGQISAVVPDDPPGAPAAAAHRFSLEAELRQRTVSADGRFALEASARYVPEVKSANARFALKAVNVPAVSCDPFPDPIFSSGFEAP